MPEILRPGDRVNREIRFILDHAQPTKPTRWRKRPVEVEAMQWTGDNAADLAEWTDGAFIADDPKHPATLYVAANQTRLPLVRGEWVLRDSLGFYPCADSAFTVVYEQVADA